MTRSQVISFILAVVICLFFILAGYPPVTEVFSGWAPSWLVAFVSRLGFLPHFASIKRGVLDLGDIVYFLSVTIFMLSANNVLLQSRRTA
jgi:ABC-2 type transport system permease protein